MDNIQMANALNDYCITIGQTLVAQQTHNHTNSFNTYLNNSNASSIYFKPIT